MKTNTLFTNLGPNTLLLTPNLRLARTIQAQHSEWQIKQGKQTWTGENILAYSTWLSHCWDELQIISDETFPLLLTEQQCLSIWENIIQNTDQDTPLLNLSQTASNAISAWNTLHEWAHTLEVLQETEQEDVQAFMSWASRFRHTCQERAWLTTAEMPEIIQKHFHQLPQQYTQCYLLGFEELTPQQNNIINTLAESGCEIINTQLEQQAKSIARLCCHDVKEEITTMARWAKQENSETKKSIACIVPQLHEQRNLIEEIFSTQFSDPTDYNISGGRALTSFPLIATAIQLLQLFLEPYELKTMGSLLRSPFLGEAAEEKNERALLDCTLRDLGENVIALKTVLQHSEAQEHPCPKLIERLTAWQKIQKRNFEQTPSRWADFFAKQLACLGWPGERSLNSHEYQTVQRWLNLLTEFSRFDTVLPSLSQYDALQTLTQLAKNTLFQVQTTDAPIQVLGMLEAAGIPFDRIWVMGLSDDVWPQAANPNPFLPLDLQRKENMPHASAERELLFAERLTQRFCDSCENIIFSFPKQDQDRELSPSPCILDFPEMSLSDLHTATLNDPAKNLFESRDIEFYADDQGPACDPDEAIRGGTFILKHQAACPFKAFAYTRLQAEALPEVDLGLSALERGLALHHCLEMIWQKLKNQSSLLALSESQEISLLKGVINTALQLLKQKQPYTLNNNFLKLEQQRLHGLLTRWLEIEKDRPAFEVLSIEKRQHFQIDVLQLRMRADRIDQDEQGNVIVIDYKTGLPNINEWFTDPISEPQLPLYALSDRKVNAIVYAYVRSNKMGFNGISQSYCGIEGVIKIEDHKFANTDEWMKQCEHWGTEMETLAQDFIAGDARVAPRTPMSCQYCDLHGLCRVNEI